VKRAKLIATFAALAMLALMSVATVSASGVGDTTFTAVADAFVDSSNPSVNHGADPSVSMDATPVEYGYFKFNVTVPAGEHITRATFSCYALSANPAGAGIWTTSSNWSESTLTYANAPLPNFTLPPSGTTGPTTASAYTTPADVTSAITGAGTYTLVLKTKSTSQWPCASRENTGQHPAKLVVTTAAAPPPPTAHKVLVILEENHNRAQAEAGMPYLVSLGNTYGKATGYNAISHPSLPNYLAIWGGSTFGITSDCPVAASGCVPTPPSVWGQTLAAGKTAKAYQESMTSNCQTSSGNAYVARHSPWPYWIDSTERGYCNANDVPLGTTSSGNLRTDIANGSLPVTGEITPNLNNDAHDGSLATADNWLKSWMPIIMAGPDYTSGHLTVIITFDEGNSSSNNVTFDVVDPRLHSKVVTGSFNHYSLTKWLDDNAGVADLRNAATAPDLRAAFGL
jgi:phosphatidylinositol-3-phosphatase